MCLNQATSSEHVPPQCIFPEKKDTNKDLRINLITVPSCEEHNQRKSHDDQFLMVCLAGLIGNNSIGFQHFNGKIQRALRRTSYKLLEDVFLKKKLIKIENENGFMELLWGTPDYDRLIRCFSNIGYGIHRAHFKTNFNGTVKPYLEFLHHTEQNPKEFKEFIKHRASIDLAGQAQYGENPDVFWYQFTKPDQFGLFLVKLKFYQNVEVFISYIPTGFVSSRLDFELMNLGVKTIIGLEGKNYEFN